MIGNVDTCVLKPFTQPLEDKQTHEIKTAISSISKNVTEVYSTSHPTIEWVNAELCSIRARVSNSLWGRQAFEVFLQAAGDMVLNLVNDYEAECGVIDQINELLNYDCKGVSLTTYEFDNHLYWLIQLCNSRLDPKKVPYALCVKPFYQMLCEIQRRRENGVAVSTLGKELDELHLVVQRRLGVPFVGYHVP